MSTLDVPGARLFYETQGRGPLLIMIPGSGGAGDAFTKIAPHLAERYTVVTYDRRGFSRSVLDGPPDDDRRLATDADDVARLIEYLSDAAAIVLGVSSGALVALEVLVRHPSAVSRLVAHEPPAVRQLPDGADWLEFFQSVYDLQHQSGMEVAVERFRARAFAETDRQAMSRMPNTEFTLANAKYWFEHELRQYPTTALDLDALGASADRIVLTAGRESRGTPCYRVSAELSKRLCRDLVELPGGHLGCVLRPAEFAAALEPHLEFVGQPGDHSSG